MTWQPLQILQHRWFLQIRHVYQLAHHLAGYGNGIYNSARHYSGNGIGQGQYRRDLGNALRSNGASASAAASGILCKTRHAHSCSYRL